jgi:hypothetical protein
VNLKLIKYYPIIKRINYFLIYTDFLSGLSEYHQDFIKIN